MLARVTVAVIGIVELIVPRRVADFLAARLFDAPERVEVRGWVVTAIRIGGLLTLGWALWASRDRLEELVSPQPVADWEDDLGPTDEMPPGETTEPEMGGAAETGPTPLRPDTTRFTIATFLAESEDPVPVSEIVEESVGTDREIGRSTASATLYRMYQDGLVDRRERDEGRGYVYWLTDDGEGALDAADEPVEPGASEDD